MKTERLLALILVLLDRNKLSAATLADMFAVSTRTIYRDVTTLSLAGIPITTTPGINGGISIMKHYKVDKKLFSKQELAALLIGLNTVASTLDRNKLTKTLIKIQSLIPQQDQQDIKLETDQLFIDLTAWHDIPSIQVMINQIKKALEEHSLLQFTYHDRNGNETWRQVEPYRLILKEASWYLEAYCLLRTDFRLFKLTRISELEQTDTAFNHRPFSPTSIIGSKPDNGQFITVRLLVDASLRERITEQFGGTIIDSFVDIEQFGIGCLIDIDEQKLLATIPFRDEPLSYDLLLGLGPRAECLSPVHIREKLKLRIDELKRLYGPTT